MSERISLKGLNRGAVLAALYNASKPQGMGFMHYDPTPMTAEKGNELIEGGHVSFDYLKGRVMKVDLSGEDFDPRLYDRDNGEGAAAKAITVLAKSGNVDAPEIAGTHRLNTLVSAHETEGRPHDETSMDTDSEVPTMTLGLSDVVDVLGPRIAEARNRLRSH